jgi:hypothetical protein
VFSGVKLIQSATRTIASRVNYPLFMKLIIIPGRCLGPLIILFFIHHGLAQENTLARLNAFSTGRVYRDKVEPHWFDGDSKFWYRVDVAARQHEFILVDAEKGSRQPAKCFKSALRRAGSAVSRIHASLAARPARHGRHLGEALV